MLLGCSKILRHSTGTTKIQAARFGYEHPILSEVSLISITCGSAHQLIFKVLLILIIVFFELYLFAMLMNRDYLAKCFSSFNCMPPSNDVERRASARPINPTFTKP
ncbi:hypothetical protein M758_3G155100 [Ceratodon purpureus]|nr:hypothetical protein M758_3G155100 [Ceratodon purpureus]